MIGIIGNFGYRTNQLDGQTIKTRLLFDGLLKYSKFNLEKVDTSFLKKNPLKVLLKILLIFYKSDFIIIMPGIRGLKFLIWLFILLNKIFRTKGFYYVVIGGWLFDIVSSNRKIKKALYHLDGIFVEPIDLYNNLKPIYENTYNMVNFRDFDERLSPNSSKGTGLKCLFIARVYVAKGIDIALEGVSKSIKINSDIELDIFGPIQSHIEDKLLEDYSKQYNQIRYKGLLDAFDEDFYNKISKYDVIVFPTSYNGEGIPGTIIDGFIAGVPVVASDWKYNKSLIDHNINGLILKENNAKELCEVLLNMASNKKILNLMKLACIEKRKKYHTKVVINNFINQIGLFEKNK